jgi:hypothetical protein
MSSLHLSSDILEVYKRLAKLWKEQQVQEKHEPLNDDSHEDDPD